MIGQEAVSPVFDFDAVFAPDDYLYFYETSLPEGRNNKEVDLIESALKLKHEHRILDVACGHGRLTNLLAKRGYNLTGIDRSSGFLEIAGRDAKKLGLEVKYLPGDMRKLEFDSVFDRALVTFTAFGYFNDAENLNVLTQIRRALIPGGLFLFDVVNRDTFLRRYVPFIVTERDEDLMIDRPHFDYRTGRLTTHRTTIRAGKRRDMRFSMRLYNLSELDNMLKQAGMLLVETYGSYAGLALEQDPNRLVIVARREG
ncbi:hypothetical protein AUK22_08915 [bacterium CG2_30_54_10]|nr:MAG: hypothetical protein AUK22_08915 [bacterium CG2_30_54_10]